MKNVPKKVKFYQLFAKIIRCTKKNSRKKPTSVSYGSILLRFTSIPVKNQLPVEILGKTSQLLKKYKNYSHLQAFYSPYLLPPGGAGVTSAKNQLTSGSGVAIY